MTSPLGEPTPLPPAIEARLDDLITSARIAALSEREYSHDYCSREEWERDEKMIDAYRAALSAEIGKLVEDAERLDWLERKSVRVGTKLDLGTFVEWWAYPALDDDGKATLPSDLRARIDAARSTPRPPSR